MILRNNKFELLCKKILIGVIIDDLIDFHGDSPIVEVGFIDEKKNERE